MAPRRPSDLPRGAWWGVIKRTFAELGNDKIQDWAAALTYYGVLSIFPALIVLVSLLGLLGQDDISNLVGQLSIIAPKEVQDLLTGTVRGIEQASGTLSVFAIVGLLVALWSASGYIAAFVRASNAIYDIDEGRPIWKLTPLRLGLTLLVMVLLAVCVIAVTLTGDLADVAGDMLGLSDGLVLVWNIVKWPVIAVIAAGLIMVLYWAAPNVRQPGVRWITPGGILAVLLFVLVSVGFALYVANFGSYNKTYGTLATVVVFLVWLWLSNLAVLFGAELDAELARARNMAMGNPVDREPYAVPRDPPKPDTLPE
ncbi:YihY/virulence factor BrkB family protein [Nonomuraea soli]|uniref:Membrane protein n=1 Tax=Nonomuraea soli TaxID=1032476 RepID=A0A7W0HTB3_9ACTN|nr:YihY/virulence factor BrkB family protein [Nonomuraea soli]MBA2894865.1 membrane protein [Nonomuraea soli]